MIDAKIQIFHLEYGQGEAEIKFKFNGKEWDIKHFPRSFSSSKAAENQAKKLAEKLGFNIIDVEID